MIVIRSGRHPHEVLILSGCVVYGVAGFSAFDRVAITSIRELPGPVGHMFYALLAVTAAVALVGSFLPGLIGQRVEQGGLLLVAAHALVSVTLVFAALGLRATAFAIFMLCIASANVWRAVQIHFDLRRILAAAVMTGSVDQLEGP